MSQRFFRQSLFGGGHVSDRSHARSQKKQYIRNYWGILQQAKTEMVCGNDVPRTKLFLVIIVIKKTPLLQEKRRKKNYTVRFWNGTQKIILNNGKLRRKKLTDRLNAAEVTATEREKMKNFGEKLKELREERNLSQKELGDKMGGITQQTIAQYEKKEAVPKR